MEEEEDMSPPFWLQNGSPDRRRLRRSYSLFLSSGALLIFLLVTALAFILIIVPTLHSFTSHIFKPQVVKKSWDFLNLVLVLFAIVCGFLSRNSNESPRSYEDQSFSDAPQEYAKSNPATPRPWYEYTDRTSYKSLNRLRSINSYPDLRQESSWVAADERWRFYDDTHVSGYRGLDLDDHRQPRPEAEEEEEEELGIKNIAVDTFVVRTKEVPTAPPLRTPQPPASPSPLRSSPPPAPPSKDVRTNAKRTYQAIGQEEKIKKLENNGLGSERLQPPPPTPPPPPPPLPTERKTGQNKKKRASATKEFLTSLKGKKKKQRQRSVENFESILNSEPPPLASQPSPSPLPPQPPSVFHNLFSPKKSKHKKRHSASPPPHISSMPVSKTKPLNGGVATHKSVLSNRRENYVITGNESPLIPIPPPPPPPPPPFKLPAWKFRVHGDFVRVDSISSSRSGSPDLDEVMDSPTSQPSQCNSPSATDGGEAAILLFYPSPDVDTKADTFIESFRAGLRMEKINSMKKKQGIGSTGRSNLGPSLNTQTKEKTGPS